MERGVFPGMVFLGVVVFRILMFFSVSCFFRSLKGDDHKKKNRNGGFLSFRAGFPYGLKKEKNIYKSD